MKVNQADNGRWFIAYMYSIQRKASLCAGHELHAIYRFICMLIRLLLQRLIIIPYILFTKGDSIIVLWLNRWCAVH